MDGVTVMVLRGEFVVPGIPLRLHFKHEAALDALQPNSKVPPKESNLLCLAFALDILRQNYPDMTKDTLLDQAAMVDIGAIIGAALPQSGYSRRPLELPASASPEPSLSVGSSTPPAGDPATSST